MKDGVKASRLKNTVKYQVPDQRKQIFVMIGEDYVPVDVQAKFITDDETYAYLSFNRHANCWKVKDTEEGPVLVEMDEDEDATEMAEALRERLARVSYEGMNEVRDLPLAVKKALDREAPGFKIVYDKSGKPMLVKPKHPGRPRSDE